MRQMLCSKLPHASRILSDVCIQSHEKVPRHLEAEPAAGHARRDFQEVWSDALVQTSIALVLSDDSDRVKDGFVLVSHARHGVDLEPSAKNIAVLSSAASPVLSE